MAGRTGLRRDLAGVGTAGGKVRRSAVSPCVARLDLFISDFGLAAPAVTARAGLAAASPGTRVRACFAPIGAALTGSAGAFGPERPGPFDLLRIASTLNVPAPDRRFARS